MSDIKTRMRFKKTLMKLNQRFESSVDVIGNEAVTPALLRQAHSGNAAAQYRLACCYAADNDVRQDEVTACKWFKSAAEAGHVPAMFRLGQTYLHGGEVVRNRVRGLHYLLKAANHGNIQAIDHLGSCYRTGDGLPKRNDLAAKWLSIAANRGSVNGMLSLAHLYKHGIGVEQSTVKCFVCLTVAAARSGGPKGSPFISEQVLAEKLTDEQHAEVRRLSANMLKGGPLDL